MVEIDMKAKRKLIHLEDKNWYKAHCKKCPYLVNDEIMKKVHCVRPVGEGCLAESLLVAGCLAADDYNARITAMYAARDKKSIDDEVVVKLSEKRRCKLPKRRR